MKKLNIIGGLIVMFIFGSACDAGSLDYRVRVENIGQREIKVDSIKLFESKKNNAYNKALAGWIIPGSSKTSLSHSGQPDPELKVSWKVLATDETFEKPVSITLPKLFPNKEYGATIIIYINSDTNEVSVKYRVFDPKIKDFIVVDS